MKHDQDVLRSLPILAVAFGRRHGIEVRIGGHQASVTGKVLRLPSLPMDASAKLVTLAFGYMAHETGHLEFTELGLKAIADSPLHASFYGVIEDVRMEAERNRRYIGSASRLSELVDTLGKEGGFGTEESVAEASAGDVIAFGALSRLRYGQLDQPLEEVAKLWEPRLNELLGKVGRIKFDALLAEVQHLANSREALAHARRLVTLMEDLAKDPPEEKPEDKPESDPSKPDDATDKDDDQQQDGDQNSDPAPGDGDESSDDADGNDGDGEGDGSAGDGADDGTQPNREAIKAMLDGTDGKLSPTDIGDIVSAELGQQAAEEVKESGCAGSDTVSNTLPVSRALSGVSEFGKVAAASLSLRTRLRSRMESASRTKASRRDYGSRFDPMAAADFIRGESKLFQHRDVRRKVDTAVQLLTDKSISMRSGKIEPARQATLALAHGLEQIQGVVTAAAAFPNIEVMKGFREKAGKVAGQFAVPADGESTPMAEAMLWACSSLATRRESRKILVVVTDGAPNDREAVKALLKRLKRSRIECIGVGIGDDTVKQLFPVSCVIKDVSELATALFGVIGNQLEIAA